MLFGSKHDAGEAQNQESAQSQGGAVLAPELMARVHKIQLRTQRMVSNMLSGAYRSTFRGTGIEFDEVRAYQPGDDVRAIDWNVTARTGEPFIKTFIEERQLTLQFTVDTSPSMDFGSRKRSKREVAAEFCALLAYVAVLQQDQVGLTLYDDRPGLHLPPGKGHQHVLRVVREVIAARPGGAGSAFATALEHVMRTLGRRSMIFIVSDFFDTDGDEGEQMLLRLSKGHDVIAVRVSDPFERELPKAGLLTMTDAESGRSIDVDTRSAAVRRAWKEAAEKRDKRVRELCSKAHVDMIEISTEGDVSEPVLRFFGRRGGRR